VLCKTKKIILENKSSKQKMVFCESCSARTLPTKFVCCECLMFETHPRQRVIRDSTTMIDRFTKEISDILQLRKPKTVLLPLQKKKSRVQALRELISHERRDTKLLTKLVGSMKQSNRHWMGSIIRHTKLRESFEKQHTELIHYHEKQCCILEKQRAIVRKMSYDRTEALLKIMPLTKLKNHHSISFFQLRDRLLPLKNIDDTTRKHICAALGAIVLFTQSLAKLHDFAMPHPMKFLSSTSRISHAYDDEKCYPLFLRSTDTSESDKQNFTHALQLLDQNVISLCEHASSHFLPLRSFQRGYFQFLPNLLLLINFNREEQRYTARNPPASSLLCNRLKNGLLPNLPLLRRTGSSGSRPSFESPTTKKE